MIFEKENVMLMTGHVMCINEMGKELSAFHLLGLAYPITPEFIQGKNPQFFPKNHNFKISFLTKFTFFIASIFNKVTI